MRHLVPLLALGLVGMALYLTPAQAQNVAWVRQFGSAQHDGATALAVDEAGNVYVAGWTDGALPGQRSAGGPRDAFVRKLGPDGGERWTRQFGTERIDTVLAVAVDEDGTVYLAGQTGGALGGRAAAGELDAFVRAYDADGNERWTRQFGGPGSDAASGLKVGPDGDLYVSGWVYGALPGQRAAGRTDAFLRRYTPRGAEVWTRQLGGAGHDRPGRPAVDAQGDVDLALAGSRAEPGSPLTTRRLGRDGTARQARPLETRDTEDVTAVAPARDGATYLLGRSDPDLGHTIVRKHSENGDALWTRELHLGGAEVVPADLAVDSAGDVYVAGKTATDGGNAFVRKYDRYGAELWTIKLATPDADVASSLALGADGKVYLAGWTAGTLAGQRTAGRSDVFVARLR